MRGYGLYIRQITFQPSWDKWVVAIIFDEDGMRKPLEPGKCILPSLFTVGVPFGAHTIEEFIKAVIKEAEKVLIEHGR